MYSALTQIIDQAPLDLLRDALDIAVVYYIFYRLLLVAKGTRAMQVAAGLVMLSILYLAAQQLRLQTITALFGSLLQSIILVVVVVFQGDIRRALQRVGSRANFGQWSRGQETEVIGEVVEAARELARHRIGALIAFEQDAHLDEFIGQNKGIKIDAEVSSELLVSLFIPEGENKLHDGAVILQNLRIAKAGVFFPMPQSKAIDNKYGSRHRAALGITEETDAVVVVVSEERGTLSFCYKGNIASDLQAAQLGEMLHEVMNSKAPKAQVGSNSSAKPAQNTSAHPEKEAPDVLKTLTSSHTQTPNPLEQGVENIDRKDEFDVAIAPEPLRKSIPPKSERAPNRGDKDSQQALSERSPSSRASGTFEDSPQPLRKSRLPVNLDPMIPEPELATRANPRPMPKAKAREMIQREGPRETPTQSLTDTSNKLERGSS